VSRTIAALTAALTLGTAGAATAGTSPGASAMKAAAVITTHSSRYGKVLFDGHQRVLYSFARDRGKRSTCYGACAKAWPPFIVSDAPRTGPGVRGALAGTTRRRDGRLQATYAGRPLYYFKGDTKPRQIKCQNVSNFGGLWLVVNPSGRAVR
jgi:predicted lipoprotein with Yx(FWY)xxD motif